MPPRCTPAPSCTAALEEASRRWPERRRASDGICASSTHTRQNPSSDHEPHVQVGQKHYATAFDLTDDKDAGCDADKLVEQLRRRRDPRVKYVIAERRMFSSYDARGVPAWTWRPYTGDNPHSSHVHVSIVPEAIHDTGPWWGQEDDDMKPDERDWLSRIHHELVAGDTQPSTVVQTLERLEKKVDALAKRVAAIE